MMKWACEVADRLLLPMWLECTPAGRPLYEKFGFVWLEKGAFGDHMKRETMVDKVEGGRSLQPLTPKTAEAII